VGLGRGVIGRCLEHARWDRGAKKAQWTLSPSRLAHPNHHLWMARRRADRLPHVAALHSPVIFLFTGFPLFDSSGQAKSGQYRARSNIERCFGWKNDPSAHNNHREARNTPTYVCLVKYPEREISVRSIEWYINICARLGRPIITNATSEDSLHWIM
jgi:hypothetical protein